MTEKSDYHQRRATQQRSLAARALEDGVRATHQALAAMHEAAGAMEVSDSPDDAGDLADGHD